MLAVMLLVANRSYAQLAIPTIETIMKQGDSETLSDYFSPQIDLTFSGKTTAYSKRQASLIIRKFFSNAKPNSFSDIQFPLELNNNSTYILGKLGTSNGVYQVYIVLVEKNNALMIRGMRFTK
jgi:hypothetical protein